MRRLDQYRATAISGATVVVAAGVVIYNNAAA